MSVQLLQRMKWHLDQASLLDGYQVKFYRWSDQDLNGDGQVILFRMPGTEGDGAHVIQRPDVEISMVCDPDQVKAGDERMLQILQHIRDDFETDAANPFGRIFNMWPIGVYTGPRYMQNNRAMFSLVVRCMTTDH